MGHLVDVVGMLTLGTASSVCMKVMLGLRAPGYGGVVHSFDKPFMQSVLMFFGMAFAALFKPLVRRGAENNQRPPLKNRVLVALPAAFDLFASTLMTFGLIWINVSIFQMLRGSMVIFSAILSIKFLKKKITPYQWLSIALTCIALVMIGVAGIFIPGGGEDQASVSQKILGCALVVLSQLVQAGQIVVEEFILKDVKMHPLDIVSWEGIWGLLMMAVVACPFAFIVPGDDPSPLGSSLENIVDSFIQLCSSAEIAVVSAVFVVVVMVYNIFGMLVVSGSSAIFRTILEAARTLLIWIVMLIAEKCGASFGEIWCSWSWLELAGFIVLTVSTFIYNGSLKVPGFKYQVQDRPLIQ